MILLSPHWKPSTTIVGVHILRMDAGTYFELIVESPTGKHHIDPAIDALALAAD